MDQRMWLQYPSSIEKIVEYNESFDSCIIRICYNGKNRNTSSLSKASIEKAIPSIFNCPIVCNYNVEEDTIGGHDMEIVKTPNGLKLVNLTDAIGVIPFGANYYWDMINDNGVEHEYLCIEAILWKRSSAYEKIKRDGIVSQSMEITVKSGKSVDGYYEIDDFIFTAFCLLGEDVEPCFESAALEMFSLQQYKKNFELLMADYKEKYKTVDSSTEDDINSTQNLTKGGNISLNKTELLTKYGLSAEELDFNIDDFSYEELEQKFEEMKNQDEVPAEEGAPTGTEETFSLTVEQTREQLIEALSVEKYTDPYWGEMRRYCYVDCDFELTEIYCYDMENWHLFGFKYSMNGDHAVIDFESKKRKKFSIVDFDEGSVEQDYKYAFDYLGAVAKGARENEVSLVKSEFESKFAVMQTELDGLREYKKSKMDAERKSSEDELFSRFEELNGIEAFETLRTNCSEMSLEDLESKCFEIRGRNAALNFSASKPNASTRIYVEDKHDNEPYGGIFLKYPPTNK